MTNIPSLKMPIFVQKLRYQSNGNSEGIQNPQTRTKIETFVRELLPPASKPPRQVATVLTAGSHRS